MCPAVEYGDVPREIFPVTRTRRRSLASVSVRAFPKGGYSGGSSGTHLLEQGVVSVG